VSDDRIEAYTNAEIEYRAADSTIISVAVRCWKLAPGIRDIFRIRMTMINVDSTVVATDSEYELSCTGMAMLLGINCGVTKKSNPVIPKATSTYQLMYPDEPSRTYRAKIKHQRDNYGLPTSVAYDPGSPDLQIEGY
jgi:hypothetical protein